MNLDPRFVITGITGIVLIVGAAGWYFLAPAGRRPAADNVRRAVRERMQPVMFADTLPAARTRLDVPPSPEVVQHAAGRSLPAWAGPTRVAIADRPEPALVRERLAVGLNPNGTTSVEERWRRLDEAGWKPGTDGDGLPARADVVAHVGDITTPGSLAALAATGPGSLLAPGVPAVNRADLTDDEIDDARWAEEFRKLDERLAAESRRVTHWIAETFGPRVALEALAQQQRDQAHANLIRRQAVERVTGEHRAPATSHGLRPQTPAQAKRARKRNNRNLGRADRILAEVGA
jgi:hypothetical protein